ncbi:MAG: acyl-CoA dehydrogenase family protein [Candidatus Scatomorpha sp.]
MDIASSCGAEVVALTAAGDIIDNSKLRKDNNISIQTSANLCKIYCAQAAFEVCDDAMQIMGGIGYTEDSRVSRMWRDVRVMRIGGGTDEILIKSAAKQLLK